MPLLHIFQNWPVGQIGVTSGQILAKKLKEGHTIGQLFRHNKPFFAFSHRTQDKNVMQVWQTFRSCYVKQCRPLLGVSRVLKPLIHLNALLALPWALSKCYQTDQELTLKAGKSQPWHWPDVKDKYKHKHWKSAEWFSCFIPNSAAAFSPLQACLICGCTLLYSRTGPPSSLLARRRCCRLFINSLLLFFCQNNDSAGGKLSTEFH